MTLDTSRYRVLGNVNEIQAAEEQQQPVAAEPMSQQLFTQQPIDLSKYKKVSNINDVQEQEPIQQQQSAPSFIPKNAPREPATLAGTAAQGLGLLKRFTWQADVAKTLATGLALEGMDDAEEASYKLGIPFDREKYMKAVEESVAPILTQDVIEEFIQDKFGVQLRPKTEGEKKLRTVAEFVSLTPKELLKVPPSQVKPPAQLSELSKIGEKYGMKPVAISEAESVTGITPRISQKKSGKIKGQLKKETKALSDAIVKKEIPAAKAREMGFDLEKTTGEYFDVATERAAQYKEPVNMTVVNKRIDNKIAELEGKAKVPSESTAKEIETLRKIRKDLNQHQYDATETIKQYRAHNDTVASLYKKTAMTGFEEAEAEAYAVANDALVDAISAQSKTQVALPFRTGNAMYKQTKNLEFVEQNLEKAMETEKGLKELLRSKKRTKLEDALGKDAVKKLDEISTYQYEIGKRLKAYESQGLDYGKSKFIRRVLEQSVGRYKGRILTSENLRNEYIQMQKQILRKEFSAAEATAKNIIESLD